MQDSDGDKSQGSLLRFEKKLQSLCNPFLKCCSVKHILAPQVVCIEENCIYSQTFSLFFTLCCFSHPLTCVICNQEGVFYTPPKTLHSLPKDPSIRNAWLKFIFNDVPDLLFLTCTIISNLDVYHSTE